MSRLGTCEGGCSEHKLELVRAAAYDELLAAAAEVRERVKEYDNVIVHLAKVHAAPDGFERAYRTAQRAARDALRRRPDVDDQTVDYAQATEHATTWWCAECGGLDAPQPCLGICVWRPVEWVKRSLYEDLREQIILDREREQRLRGLLRRIAWITPRAGHWARGWQLVQTEARAITPARGSRRFRDPRDRDRTLRSTP